MSTTTATPIMFTKEQLFADLENDGITNDGNIINNAKNEVSDAMGSIGWKYSTKKKQYDKAMAWYRLAAAENNSSAQYNIGFLYHNGLGVPVDYLLAMDWYLKAAIQNHKIAWGNIGYLFEYGQGVPVNSYKALEWYTISGQHSARVKQLKDHGIHRTQQDKHKSIEQLLKETKIIFAAAKQNEREKLNAGVEQNSNEKNEYLKFPGEETRSLQQESIDQYKRKVEEMANEIQSLKQMNSTLEVQLNIKNNEVAHLETEIKQLRSASAIPLQSTNTRIKELEKSNQNYETLLGQERKFKDNQIELVKQKMEMSLEVEKKTRDELEKKYRAVKRELHNMKIFSPKNISAYRNTIQNETDNVGEINDNSNNEASYDRKHKRNGSDNSDINYDNLDEDSGGENDLNYDSDDQRMNRNKVSSA